MTRMFCKKCNKPKDGHAPTYCRACYNKMNGKVQEAKKAYLSKVKDVPCDDCGVRYPTYVMDLDHTRGEKSFQIGTGKNVGWDRLKAEVAKCDVVCSNCHRERTWNLREKPWTSRAGRPRLESSIV